MTWVRFDDQFPIHRKVAGLSDVLYRLHTEAVFWCARNTTDGVIRHHELGPISPRARAVRADDLALSGLWHTADNLCVRCRQALADAGTAEPPDGWVIHDYLSFQPSRSKVAHERTAKAERQAKWMAAKKNTRPPKDASHPPSADASKDAPRSGRNGQQAESTANKPQYKPKLTTQSRRSARPVDNHLTSVDALDGPSLDASADASKDDAPPPPRPEGSGAEPRASDRRPLTQGGRGGRNNEQPDWRTLPAIGAPRDPVDAERAKRGAAVARELLKRPPREAS